MTRSLHSRTPSTCCALQRATLPKPHGKTTNASSSGWKWNSDTTSRKPVSSAVVVLHELPNGGYEPEVVWWADEWRWIEWD